MLAPTDKLHFLLSVSPFGSTQLSLPSVSSATFKWLHKREFKKLSPLQVGAQSLIASLRRVQQSVAKYVIIDWIKNAQHRSISVSAPQQTSMTLNERFRILKDRRTATSHAAKGSRFVTVG